MSHTSQRKDLLFLACHITAMLQGKSDHMSAATIGFPAPHGDYSREYKALAQ